MMPSTIISSALLAIIYHAAAFQDCPENQVPACTECPKTCRYLHSSIVCHIFKCHTRCVCKDGYVFNKDHVCIPQETCPEDEILCDNHGKFSECGIQRTCEEPQGTKGKCKPGCFCVDGFLYNNRKQFCIPSAQCENSEENVNCRQKDPNMEYTYCENACYKFCPGHADHCSLACDRGCFCKRGFALDRITGKCVHFENCTKILTT